MLVLVLDYGVYGIIRHRYANGAANIQWFDAGISYTMTLEADEYIDYSDLFGEEING